MALPGAVLEGAGTLCSSSEQQHASKLCAEAMAAEKSCRDYQLACASILLQRAGNESSCYETLLCSSLARLRAPRERPAAKESPRLQSLWKQLDALCLATLGRTPDFVTALESSVENTTDILSAAATLASAVLPPGRTSELMDDLCNRFWKEWVEHQCAPSSPGSGDLGVAWEGWVRCLVVLRGVQAVGTHVGSLLGEQDGRQTHTDRWLCGGGGGDSDIPLGAVVRSLASSTPSILHACYQQWLAGDDGTGQAEGVGELIQVGVVKR